MLCVTGKGKAKLVAHGRDYQLLAAGADAGGYQVICYNGDTVFQFEVRCPWHRRNENGILH